jgi:hypothetical protein
LPAKRQVLGEQAGATKKARGTMNAGRHVRLDLTPLRGEHFSIPYAGDLAEFFFRANESSVGVGSYDEWVLLAHDPHRITTGDIGAVNRTMAARTSPSRWADFTAASDNADWLLALEADWDLFATPESEWRQRRVQTRLGEAFAAVMGPYRGAAVVTKVLHIKRPRLIPVCDSYVAATMGVQLGDSSDWGSLLALVSHLREQGRRNLDGLTTIQARLHEAGISRSSVRILDALLWMRARSTGPYTTFASWLQETQP